MYVLGYSGLNGYTQFKAENLEHLTKIEQSVSQGMDAAAALMHGGKIICACAEERFTGKKHVGDFPVHAIRKCLETAGIKLTDVDIVAHNFDYEPFRELYSLNNFSNRLYHEILSRSSQIKLFKQFFNSDIDQKFIQVPHHDCHANYAFQTSGFRDKTLVLVIDGLGEIDSISVYLGENNHLEKIESFGPESSIGMLYAAVTEFLGFYPNSDEYKLMGLAAFGNPNAYKKIFDQIAVFKDGHPEIKHLFPERISDSYDRETYRYFKKYLGENLFPERKPGDEITSEHKDLTAALQAKTNELIYHLAKYWQNKTGAKSLCISGGVGLNCVANTYLAEQQIFNHIYITPAAGDDGTALGACLDILEKNDIKLESEFQPGMPFYGPEIHFAPEIHKKINNSRLKLSENLKITQLSEEALIETVGNDLINKKIVAWARGKMEFGPRALGHRSILADPRDIRTKQRLNRITKEREMFRPFAPMIKAETAKQYFEIDPACNYNHMLINAKVRPQYLDKLQAVVHVDSTSRIQTVHKSDLLDIWLLLDFMEHHIGLPVLLNTSFNLKGKPIVCSEDEAIHSFLNSDIDRLVINNYYLEKL